MMSFKNKIILLILLVGVGVGGFNYGKASALKNTEGFDFSLLSKVKKELGDKYLDVDEMDKKKMEYGMVKGLVDSLGDPYTVFLPPSENKSYNEDLSGQFGGVGISLGFKDKNLAVMTPLPKTPAEKAGLKAGDYILKIIDKENGVDRETSDISLNEAVELIRGKIGSEVILNIFREGEKEAFDVSLIRENIVVPSIEMEWVEKEGKKIAWIKLYKFTERVVDEWNEIVVEIQKEKRTSGANYGGIILDMRNNPGGYLRASVLIGSDFLKDGVVVKQKSNKEELPYGVEKGMGKLLTDDLVVLVNGGSASAAEILAGALQEHKRATLVGEVTFGKGTVQEPQDFEDGSGIHITIAKWLLPSGKNIHKEGVSPDFEVETEKQLDKAIEVLLNK
jgi:carboxyl-terminal processing protease